MSVNDVHAVCSKLVRRSIDLRQLYRHAADACEPGLRLILGENVHTLDLVIADLRAQLGNADARLPRRGSLRGAAHRRLAGWLVRAASRRDGAWIRALAHHERALLQAFEQAIPVVPLDTALVLRRQLPRLLGIHLDMHSLVGTAGY